MKNVISSWPKNISSELAKSIDLQKFFSSFMALVIIVIALNSLSR